jgi:hypothetical protein
MLKANTTSMMALPNMQLQISRVWMSAAVALLKFLAKE